MTPRGHDELSPGCRPMGLAVLAVVLIAWATGQPRPRSRRTPCPSPSPALSRPSR
jgi:hypothetical protein